MAAVRFRPKAAGWKRTGYASQTGLLPFAQSKSVARVLAADNFAANCNDRADRTRKGGVLIHNSPIY